MTTFSELEDVVFETIRAHVLANWNYLPIRWPNETFDEPHAADPSWVQFEIFGTSYGQQTFGMDQQADNRWDEDGLIWFHVMTPRGRGVSAARGAAKSLANLFRGLRLLGDDLVFYDASIGPGGPASEEGLWFMTSVCIEWRFWNAS